MAVRRKREKDHAVYFGTFTCYQWIPLIKITDAYDAVYKWMHVAYGLGYRFFGYAIMPNHVHFIIRVPEGGAINTVLANGKRFLAYEIVKRLKQLGREDVLERLRAGVRESDTGRGQKHRVFETSTDLIELFHARMIEKKLKYIHANPVSKAWRLCDDAVEYPHSSFAFYSDGRNREAPLDAYLYLRRVSSISVAHRDRRPTHAYLRMGLAARGCARCKADPAASEPRSPVNFTSCQCGASAKRR